MHSSNRYLVRISALMTTLGTASFLAAACGDPPSTPVSLHQQASTKLSRCDIMGSGDPGGIQPWREGGEYDELSRWVLDQPCGTLSAAFALSPKAEQFDLGRFACRLGFGQHCPSARCDLPPLPAQMSSCAQLISQPGCDSCNYYRCVESLPGRSCGTGGYYLGYVGKYCEIFTKWTRPRLSPEGQKWLPSSGKAVEEGRDRPPEDCARTAVELIRVARPELSGRTFGAGTDFDKVLKELESQRG